MQNCFTTAPDHGRLQELARSGGVVKKSTLTEKFGFEDFRETYPASSAIVLFVNVPSKGLRPAPPEISKLPAGTTLYTLVPEESTNG